MPRHCIDDEWDRDALFACRNLISLEFAAEHLKVATHAVDEAAGQAQGSLPLWIFGGSGQLMRKYRDTYVGIGPSAGPDLPRAWQGHSAQGLLGEARQRHASPGGLDGLNYVAN